MGVGSGTDAGTGGLPTVVVVALVVGVAVVLVLMCGITYYFKSERRIRARKEGVVGGVGHHQRHHPHQREIKDLSLTAPCLPRGGDHPPPTQPPQPPESVPIHHRYQPPPPSCMPYSVSLSCFLNTVKLFTCRKDRKMVVRQCPGILLIKIVLCVPYFEIQTPCMAM